MKKLSWFHSILFGLNLIAVLLLLAACAVPHITSVRFSFLSFLSLTVPFLVGINLLFCLFWLLKGKRQFLPSLCILIFGYFALGAFLKLNFTDENDFEDDLSIMSYNVHSFNQYGPLDNPTVFEDIKALINQEQPDIVCLQEMGRLRLDEYDNYPYRKAIYPPTYDKVTMGFFSKYPIIRSEMIDFPESHNSAAFADILYKNDTLRIYNIHLESLGITPGSGIIRKNDSDKLFKMLNNSFGKQQEQAHIIKKHMNTSRYKQFVCGDFNNTQFSNIYQTVIGDKKDSFIEKGSGYGRTLNFHKLPLRIDFILSDPVFEVQSHKNYDEKYSDHYPIMASFRLNPN